MSYLCYLVASRGSDLSEWALVVAGAFVCIAVPLSLYDISNHVLHYVRPQLQRHYLRVLWMCPIYALQSWLALYAPDYKVYLETPRDVSVVVTPPQPLPPLAS